MQNLIKFLNNNLVEKQLNKLNYYFLQRAYTQMEQSNNLQNGDKIAEHEEDYYTYFVKLNLHFGKKCAILIIQ